MSVSRCESRLSNVLADGRIEIGFTVEDPDRAADELLTPLLTSEGFSEKAVADALEAIRARERAGSTLLGPVALPHGRLAGLHRIVGGLGINKEGIRSDGGTGTKLVLAFASPSHATVDHLKFLANVARILRNDEVVSDLLNARSHEDVLAILRAREK